MREARRDRRPLRTPSFEVFRVARKLGIRFQLVGDLYFDRCCKLMSSVLGGAGTCLYHRRIHLLREYRRHGILDFPSQFPEPEVLLHEVLHIVLAVPWYGIWCMIPYFRKRAAEGDERFADAIWRIGDQPHEAKFFLGIERVWAKELMPSPYRYRLACEFQSSVAVTGEAVLGEIPRGQQAKVINQGKRIGQKVGIVDHDNRPIFRWPDWSKIDPRRDLLVRG